MISQDITKKNYEEANEWHIEKSLAHSWLPQLERFVSWLPEGGKILEVGSGGSGRDTEEFSNRGFVVDTLDYSHAAVVSLRTKFPDMQVYEADMRNIELSGESYNGVWACAAIVNLAKNDIPETLAGFYRLLRKDGVVFVSAKEGEGEKVVPDKAGERFFSFFKESELKEIMEKAGFQIRYSEVVTGLVGTRWVCIYAVK